MSYAEVFDDSNNFLKWQAMNARHRLKGKLVKCSYPYVEEVDGVFKTRQPDCPYGKGSWCGICIQHNRWKYQTGQSKGMYESAKKKRLASYNKNLVAPGRIKRMGQESPLMVTKYGTKKQIKEMKTEDRQ